MQSEIFHMRVKALEETRPDQTVRHNKFEITVTITTKRAVNDRMTELSLQDCWVRGSGMDGGMSSLCVDITFMTLDDPP